MAVDMVVMAATVATTARGLLMPSLRLRPRLSPDTVMAVDTDTVATAAAMVATVATTARGLLMPSLRLMLLLRLSPVMVIVAAMVATAMAATDTAGATDTTARGRLRLSPATATVDTAMVATVVVMVATAAYTTAMARGLLSPAMAMAGATATGVSYHRIRRSELSQKQNHKNSQR